MLATQGLRRLREWMAEKPDERTQAFVAKQVGVSQPCVSQWLRAVTRPEPTQRTALRALAGIDEAAWQTEAERERLGATLARIAGTRAPVRRRATGTEGGGR